MPVLFIYLIKANIALALFYAAYRFGLRRLTFYTLNRYFLLFGIFFSATFPLVDVNAWFSKHDKLAAGVTYYAFDWHALQRSARPDPFTVWSLLQYVFWAGVAVMAVRFCLQLLSLLRIHLRTTAGTVHEEKVQLMHDSINPFSFFRNIYINPSLHTAGELKNIIAHEKIHARGWHTADVILGEINHIFYWFNPGAWLIKIAVRENLEFITDREILRSGVDARSYQYSLLKVGGIPFAVPVANNFNFAHLKQRIRMMNKQRSSRLHLFRYLLIIPAVAFVALVVNTSRAQQPRASLIAGSILSPAMAKVLHVHPAGDTMQAAPPASALSPEGKEFLRLHPLVKVFGYGGPTNKKPTCLLLWLKDGSSEFYDLGKPGDVKKAKAKYGRLPDAPEDSLYRVKVMAWPKTGAPALEMKDTVQARKAIAYTFTRADSPATIKKNTIPSRKILAYTFFPAEGPVARIKDTAPSSPVVSGNKPHYGIVLQSKAGKPFVLDNDRKRRPPLYVIDGKKSDSGALAALNPPDIASVTVLKDASAVALYGDEGKNGVIIVKTKPSLLRPGTVPGLRLDTGSTTSRMILHRTHPVATPTRPLFIIDGKKSDAGLEDLKPTDIDSISILKGTKALERYGDAGKNGVVIITTKAKAGKDVPGRK